MRLDTEKNIYKGFEHFILHKFTKHFHVANFTCQKQVITQGNSSHFKFMEIFTRNQLRLCIYYFLHLVVI